MRSNRGTKMLYFFIYKRNTNVPEDEKIGTEKSISWEIDLSQFISLGGV